MGLCFSDFKELVNETKTRIEIDQTLVADNKQEVTKIKLLLLGPGESGKSTVLKQLLNEYGERQVYTTEFFKSHANKVHRSIIENLCILLRHGRESITEKNRKAAEEFLQLAKKENENFTITPEIGAVIKTLWADEGVKQTWKARSTFQIQDALQFYCEEIDRDRKSVV